MSAEVTTTASAVARGSRRRDPTFYYQSLSAVVEGDVRFGEGCVVLPNARIYVPLGYRLHVGPFCLFEDFSELICNSAAPVADHRHTGEGPAPPPRIGDVHEAPPSAEPVASLRIGSHNHFCSYARLCCAVAPVAPSPRSPSSPTWQLMGRGNILHPFATVLVPLPRAPSSLARPPAGQPPRSFFGDYSVVTTHSSVSLPQGGAAAAPLANVGERGEPQMWGGKHDDTQQLPAPVEERLFQDEDDVDDLGSAHAQTQEPQAYSVSHPRAGGCIPSKATSLSASAGPSIEASSGFQHLIFFGEARAGVAEASAASAVSARSVPRFGTRSVAELPVVIKRITDEVKAEPQMTAETVGTASAAATPPLIASASSPSGSAAVASPTAAMLERYVADVHPQLRLHEEKRIITEVERLCRYYMHQFLDDRGLKQVETQ